MVPMFLHSIFMVNIMAGHDKLIGAWAQVLKEGWLAEWKTGSANITIEG
jgi:hypothetical protein